ncbi:hypothetical protein EXIGLDRAFT_732118 [Exidia glandulosa HHB12029]|uniref:Uncharacterized protein n=1 Tax=Exidia glandulosa HHB12029 TaxID=1314781 RepID=A0A165BMA2_EXIGL|nr:hypothetical protein EXIGLDRAFT_732118 [Exidia glandulosa HHB12029]
MSLHATPTWRLPMSYPASAAPGTLRTVVDVYAVVCLALAFSCLLHMSSSETTQETAVAGAFNTDHPGVFVTTMLDIPGSSQAWR